MRIEFYITQLLYRYPCVIVSGFGAFIAENKSAVLDIDNNTIYPPKRIISFNSLLKSNDGLLANHISKIEKISYQEALTLIEDEAHNWHLALEKDLKIELKNIGKFIKTSQDKLLFNAQEEHNFLTTSFGLAKIISPEVKREVYKETVEKIEEKAPIFITTEKRENKLNLSWQKYAAVFVFSLGIGGFFASKWYQQKIENETILVEKAVQKRIENKIQEATFFISNPLPNIELTQISLENQQENYFIVAGAFKNEYYAERAKNNLLQLGYDAKILEKNNHGLYPVVYEGFSKIEEAKETLDSIRKTHNKDAWMLIK